MKEDIIRLIVENTYPEWELRLKPEVIEIWGESGRLAHFEWHANVLFYYVRDELVISWDMPGEYVDFKRFIRS